MNIAIFVSGNGTNCENIIKHFNGNSHGEKVALVNGNSSCNKVSLVISNRADAYALIRAEKLGVPTVVLSKEEQRSPSTLLALLNSHAIGFIVLAGYMQMIPDFLVDAFPQRIVNIHPSLLPKYGGKGMWGHHVHEAVKAAGESETGITIHYVSQICDGGTIIAQYKTSLTPNDTVADIEAKVHELEKQFYPITIEKAIAQSPL